MGVTDELVEALAPLFGNEASVSNAQLAAIAGALDQEESREVLAACCRAVALRSLIVAAMQSNNAEAARRAAMTLLERFADEAAEHGIEHPETIAQTRRLLEQDGEDGA